MSPDRWPLHYREAVRGLRSARRQATAKRRAAIERDKDLMGGLNRIVFIANDVMRDSDCPIALESIREVANTLINRHGRKS